ncbi:class I SAM-dependent methyltransferase [Streptacidiphilus melanogenes]|uniref:class I SAM-dependent methyltransferase n=1 Tax=Streptacidiphilus melanogenes TaxID=411235 RepID=UPI0005A77F37|nr:class I SAM-dependent methyltransferase [Streptacidiphilus melanogenes]
MAHGEHGHGHRHDAHGHGHTHAHGHGHGLANGEDEELSFAAPRPGDQKRIELVWPFVREQLAGLGPGSVLEIGCGVLGGFVPLLRAEGHRAVGVDPEAPEGPGFVRSRYEDYKPDADELPYDAVVACLSLHHVEDLDALLASVAAQVRPGGLLVLREWAREEFDEATACWCFDRLPEEALGADENADENAEGDADENAEGDADEDPAARTPAWWLAGHRQGWQESGGSWDDYFQGWAEGHGLLSGAAMLDALERSAFETVLLERDPYFHTALVDVTADEERAAVDAGVIRANGLRYVGRRRSG